MDGSMGGFGNITMIGMGLVVSLPKNRLFGLTLISVQQDDS